MKRSLLVVVLVGSTAFAANKIVDRVIAVVNDEIVLSSEVDQWVIPMMRGVDPDAPAGKKKAEELKRSALDKLIDSKLVAQQAVELKLSVTSEEVDRALEEVKRQNNLGDSDFVAALQQQGFTLESYKKSLKRQILELKVMNTAVRSRIQVSDDEIQSYYNQNVRALRGKDEVHLRMVLIGVPAGASDEDAARKKKVAETVAERARAGTSFAELAKQFSDDDLTKSLGGDLGWVGPGMLVDELDQVTASMDPGDVRGPIRTSRGWHVLQLVERKAGSVKSFDDAKEQIRKQLYDEQVEKASQSWIKELRKKAHIDIRL